MNMPSILQSPPRILRPYLAVWCVVGVCSIAYALERMPPVSWSAVAKFMLLGVLLNLKTVRGRQESSESAAGVSISSIAAFAAIVGVHPLAAVPVEVCGALMDSTLPHVRPLYQTAFNIAVCAASGLAAGLAYQALGGPPIRLFAPDAAAGLSTAAAPMLVAALVYFLINAFAVAQIVGAASGTPIREVWLRNFKTTFIGNAACGVCALLALGLSGQVPLLTLGLLIGPLVYTCYSREQTDEARVVALEKGRDRLQRSYIASIKAMALTVAAKDPYTSGHIHRVTAYALAIARHIGCGEDELTDLETGALLHDVGKIGVPEDILTKPDRLTDSEMAAMRRHPEIGWNILSPLDFPEVVKQIVRNHHEWHNGAGYPDGLTGDQLPLLVRIVCVADVFDALTSARPYRGPLSVEMARGIMQEGSGTHFDPALLGAFFEVLDTVPWEELSAAPSDTPGLTDLLHASPVPAPPAPSHELVHA
jgi:putative nucleotidyltransferase with HDIG domain